MKAASQPPTPKAAGVVAVAVPHSDLERVRRRVDYYVDDIYRMNCTFKYEFVPFSDSLFVFKCVTPMIVEEEEQQRCDKHIIIAKDTGGKYVFDDLKEHLETHV